jgi:hypothetical protein
MVHALFVPCDAFCQALTQRVRHCDVNCQPVLERADPRLRPREKSAPLPRARSAGSFIEDLLAERGITLSREAIRLWFHSLWSVGERLPEAVPRKSL